MGKLLRVLVIVILLLSIGALVLGVLLFNRRELLKGRTQKLEAYILKFDKVLEAQPGAMDSKPEDPERDTSSCTVEVLANPERSDFWTTYNYDLEVQEPAEWVNTADKEDALKSYYKKDFEGKVERDKNGFKMTSGEGTMEEVLKTMFDAALAQYERLNSTRQQLSDLRTELIDTITELNKTKNLYREALKKIKELEEEIIRLKTQIEALKTKITELEEEITRLNDKIDEQGRQLALLQEAVDEKDREIEDLKKELNTLSTSGGGGGDQKAGPATPVGGIEHGDKGEVVAVNDEWGFVVIKANDVYMHELLGDDLGGEEPVGTELLLRRKDKDGAFVTKLSLVQVRREKHLLIMNVLPNWIQIPVQVGDVAYY